MNSSIEIVMRKIGELKPYENNPRHNDMAVDAVAASIQQFGFKNPVIIDKDGVIVAGHTRYKAAKKLGITDIPCISADDLSDEQIKAFRLADNKTAELIQEVEATDIPEEIREFLIQAARRHNVFNYRNIAEYYAHAEPEVQKLFEKSALVIIDVNDAIANGYVQLATDITDIMEGEADEE